VAGIIFSLIANGIWVAQPLYWPLVDSSGPVELMAHRVIWSAVVCVGIVVATPRLRTGLLNLSRSPRELRLLAAAGACLALAWGIYIYAATTGHVVEASVGLFIIPLAIVALGIIVFGERLHAIQWLAMAGAGAATVMLTVAYGRLPWIALTLAGIFAIYAMLKKKAAAAPAVEGFTVECLAVAPMALVYLIVLLVVGEDTVFSSSVSHTSLVAASGLTTSIPLLCYAASLRRLPLTALGIIGYINPTGQFLIGVMVGHEHMSATHWIGFTVMWAAVAAFILSSVYRPAGRLSSTRSSR
jgi:chloramphenicol-sensitive protein RarD